MSDLTAYTSTVSIVVPCFNEEDRIAASISALKSWFDSKPEIEILIVDDGSTDRTVERALAAAGQSARVRVHRVSENRGKGAALVAALPLVHGDKIVFVDADLAFDRGSVSRIVDALDDADLAIGNRRHRESRYSVPVRLFGFLYRRHLIGLTFNLLVRGALGFGFRDTQCGLKGYRREALHHIVPSLTIYGFAFDVEMLVIAEALGLRIAQVPVLVTYESARSSVQLVRGGIKMAAALVRIALRRWILRYSSERVRAAAARAQQPLPRR